MSGTAGVCGLILGTNSAYAVAEDFGESGPMDAEAEEQQNQQEQAGDLEARHHEGVGVLTILMALSGWDLRRLGQVA